MAYSAVAGSSSRMIVMMELALCGEERQKYYQ